MKNFRGTIFFAVVVIAVGIFALLEFKKDQKEKSDQPTKDNIFHEMKAEETIEFSFSSPTINYLLKKENGSWKVIEPTADTGDSEAVDSALRDLFTENVTRIDSPAAIDWAKYGLAQPQGEFHFKTATVLHKVAIGTIRTYNQGFYLKRDDESQLFAGEKSWENIIAKTARDFRSKAFHLPEIEMTSLTLKSNDSKRPVNYNLVKSEQGWSYAKDKKIRINSGAVEDILNELRHFKNDAIVSDMKSPDEIKKWNLNTPELEVILTYQEKGKPASQVSLAFSKAQDNNVTSLCSESPAIYRTSKSKVDPLFKNLEELRDKAFPFNFDQAQVRRIEIKPGGDDGPVKLVKTDNNWTTDDGHPQAKVDQAQVDTLLNEVRLLRVASFNPPGQKLSGLDHAIVFKDQSGKDIFSLEFGNKFINGKDTFYVGKSSLTQEAFTLNKSAIDDLKYKKLVDDGHPQAAGTKSK